MKLVPKKDLSIGEPTIIEGLPDVGLAGTLATTFLIDQLKMEEIAHIESDLFPPVMVLHHGILTDPFRIFAKDDLVVITSEMAVPAAAIYSVGEVLGSWLEEIQAKQLISLGGIPIGNRMEITDPKVFGAGNREDALQRLRDNGINIMEEGFIAGTYAILMKECLKRGIPATLLLSDEVAGLMASAEGVATGRMYSAEEGMADFFTYRLTIQTVLTSEKVEWVDEWASAETLPEQLIELQSRIESIVIRIQEQGGGAEEERATAIAKEFVLQGPTFSFDGIPNTLAVTDTVVLESFPPQYRITMRFDSSHAGYGNREGEALAQVITMHEVVVTVVRDNVISAVIDFEWDEIEQVPREVRPPLSSSGPPPQIILVHSGEGYQGLQSTYCWGALCVDYVSVEMREDLVELVPIDVIRGARLSIRVEDHDPPERFFIQFYSVGERSWIDSIEVNSASFIVDLDPGEYFLILSTAWEMEGDISNIFRMAVAEP